MNYFELFEIPVSLTVDKGLVQKKYFELQKKYHPDFFSNESDVEQAAILEKSSLINKACKTFQNTDETIKYVLKLKNLLEEEEKYQLPSEFLSEVMELNETLMDIDDSNVQQVETQVNQLEKALFSRVQNIIEYYDEERTTDEQLLQVKEYYFQKKYLQRILDRLDGMRNIAPSR